MQADLYAYINMRKQLRLLFWAISCFIGTAHA
jgi:hypothetical protein